MNWTEISTVQVGTVLTVQYQAALSSTSWSSATSAMRVRFVYESDNGGLGITSKHSGYTASMTLDLTTDAPTTAAPTVSPTTGQPTVSPTIASPTMDPTTSPSEDPTSVPSKSPTMTGETRDPTTEPTTDPTTAVPTTSPTTYSPTTSTTFTTTTTTDDDDDYTLCVEQSGTGQVDLEIYRNEDTQMMKIKLIGPDDAWFGFGFGSTTMPGTYSVIGQGSTLELVERTLGSNSGGTVLSSSGDSEVSDDGDTRTVILTRGYDEDGTYDFTNFMDCSTSSMEYIAAHGSSNSFGYHASRTWGTASNNCCVDDVDAANMRCTMGSILILCAVLLILMQ